ncbi:hypothetical protein JCM6882_000127 [Rhodosporidiobolus microsporus]
MAPHARLTFTPAAPPPASPVAQQATTHISKPLPPLPPTIDVTGTFSLLPTGGVLVGETSVRVERGTAVERTREGEGAGADERAGRGLWWHGQDGDAREGKWELLLLGATEADLVAVHRILLFLPPSAPDPLPLPSFHSTSANPAPYRNSLILFDETSRSVIGVIPLSTTPPSRPYNPAPHAHPPEPSPSFHPPAADFAHYIDHVAESLHPSPTPEEIRQQRGAEEEKRERLAKEEEESNELPFPLPFLDYALRPAEANAAGEVDDGKQPDRSAHEQRRLEKGLERLDLEMELACEHKSTIAKAASPPLSLPSAHPASSRPASTWTVSTFATFGTERFVTADEGAGEEEGETSRRSSFAPTILEVEERLSEGDETPRPTLLPSTTAIAAPALAPTPSPASAVPPPPQPVSQAPSPLPIPSNNPMTTLTNGNAVLLSFLNAPTTFLPPPSPSSPVRKVSVSAHPLSAERASEMTLRGEIKPAELDGPQLGAEGDKEGGEDGGWWSWLSGLWRPVDAPSAPPTPSTANSSGTVGWLDWLFPSFASSSATASVDKAPLALPRARQPRRASGEATARLSVYHVDEEGWGRRAFVQV